MGSYLNPGNSGFSNMRNDVYVDKTEMISLINQTINTPRNLTCISRPRRFGKSFAAKTLCAYYDKTCDSKELFHDLKIAKDGVNYPISIVIATTNYYDKLDPAVKRYGRFDLTIKMDNFNKDEAQEMCDIYGLELNKVVKNSNSNKFSISPAKLQALCLKNIDNKLKGNLNNKEYIDGRIVIHRIKK